MSELLPATGGNSHQTAPPTIRTIIDTTGQAKVLFSMGPEADPFRVALTPDAATTIALNLLAAAYAARSEQAAFKYAIDNNIEPSTLIKYVRDNK